MAVRFSFSFFFFRLSYIHVHSHRRVCFSLTLSLHSRIDTMPLPYILLVSIFPVKCVFSFFLLFIFLLDTVFRPFSLLLSHWLTFALLFRSSQHIFCYPILLLLLLLLLKYKYSNINGSQILIDQCDKLWCVQQDEQWHVHINILTIEVDRGSYASNVHEFS
jgi:hypothetical protein